MSVEALAEEWDLTLGEPYVPGAASEHVVRVELGGGTPAVLKIGHPHRESEQEADALERCPLDRLCAEFGLDRERARAWTVVQTTAWSRRSDYVPQHMETVACLS